MGEDKADLTESIKESLNFTGLFLERWVYELIKRSTYYFPVKREVPYAIPATGVGSDGTADLVAIRYVEHENAYVCFVIECKKANPETKSWVFEKSHEDRNKYPHIYLGQENGSYFYSDTPRNFLNYSNDEQYEMAHQVFEFNDKSGSLNHNSTLKAYNSLKQVNEALSGITGIIRESSKFKLRKREDGKLLPILMLPIVVTTANLFVTDYDIKNVDSRSGTINKPDLSLKPQGWVHYDFPLPEHLRLPGKYNGTVVTPEKRSTFIVNTESFWDFLEGFYLGALSYAEFYNS